MDVCVSIPLGHVLGQPVVLVLECGGHAELHQPLHHLQLPGGGGVVKGVASTTHRRLQVTSVFLQERQGGQFSLQRRPV